MGEANTQPMCESVPGPPKYVRFFHVTAEHNGLLGTFLGLVGRLCYLLSGVQVRAFFSASHKVAMQSLELNKVIVKIVKADAPNQCVVPIRVDIAIWW